MTGFLRRNKKKKIFLFCILTVLVTIGLFWWFSRRSCACEDSGSVLIIDRWNEFVTHEDWSNLTPLSNIVQKPLVHSTSDMSLKFKSELSIEDKLRVLQKCQFDNWEDWMVYFQEDKGMTTLLCKERKNVQLPSHWTHLYTAAIPTDEHLYYQITNDQDRMIIVLSLESLETVWKISLDDLIERGVLNILGEFEISIAEEPYSVVSSLRTLLSSDLLKDDSLLSSVCVVFKDRIILDIAHIELFKPWTDLGKCLKPITDPALNRYRFYNPKRPIQGFGLVKTIQGWSKFAGHYIEIEHVKAKLSKNKSVKIPKHALCSIELDYKSRRLLVYMHPFSPDEHEKHLDMVRMDFDNEWCHVENNNANIHLIQSEHGYSEHGFTQYVCIDIPDEWLSMVHQEVIRSKKASERCAISFIELYFSNGSTRLFWQNMINVNFQVNQYKHNLNLLVINK